MTYTDDDLLDALRGFVAEHDGRPPTAPEANAREGFPSVTAFVHHFGSWNTALVEAGLEPRDRQRSDEELLADLREFTTGGKYPSVPAVAAREDMAHPHTYQRRFGSWSEALDAAGLPAFEQGP